MLRFTLLFLIMINQAILFASELSFPIIKNNKANCIIIIPSNPTSHEQFAAGLLTEHIAKSTGVKLPIYKESDRPEYTKSLHIGMTSYGKDLLEELKKLDSDGFIIYPIDPNTLIIAGSTDWGTEFGVCEFLENFLGVRWLMPGENGTYIPVKSNVYGPSQTIKDEPATFSRLLSGLPNNTQISWARRNRMRSRISFHHNINKIFPPETYTKTHPEFFPMRKGERYLPKNNSIHGWQPCFTAPDLVEEAVKNIKLYFAENPDATSFSLGVNDSGGDCECPTCQVVRSDEKTRLGAPNASELYYSWCNEVVSNVIKDYPDKLFGLLAYRNVIEAPKTFKLHEKIVPFICFDRMKWALSEEREKGYQLNQSWQEASRLLGWYDYLYGAPYLLPRVYFHLMAENYKFAIANGVKAHYAEAYPNWGEGPKLYLSLKLQWNPNQDVNALLEDWYRCCVGDNAANDLANYYEMWEEFWTGPALKSSWRVPSDIREYLNHWSPDYLDILVPDMLVKSRVLLERVVAKTKTDDQRSRAELLLRAFEYYEASAYAYFGSQRYIKAIGTEQDAMTYISSVLQFTPYVEKRESLLKDFGHDALPIQNQSYWSKWASESLKSECWGAGTLWPVYSWLDKSESVLNKITTISLGRGISAFQARSMLSKFGQSQKSLDE